MVLVSGVFVNEHGHVRLLILILAAIAIVMGIGFFNLTLCPCRRGNIFSMLSPGTLVSVVLYHVFKRRTLTLTGFWSRFGFTC